MEQLINTLDLLEDVEMLEELDTHMHHPEIDLLDELDLLEEIERLEEDQNNHPVNRRRYWVHPINMKRDNFGFFNNLLTEMRQHGKKICSIVFSLLFIQNYLQKTDSSTTLG